MKLHLFILLVFSQLLAFENTAIARGPAVEPVTGLSIEEYNETHPSKESAFDFSQPTSKTTTELPIQNNRSRTIAATNRAPERSIESLYDKSSSEYAFLIILGVLPFIIWFGLMKTIDSIDERNRSTRPRLVNSKDDNDDDDYPWVS